MSTPFLTSGRVQKIGRKKFSNIRLAKTRGLWLTNMKFMNKRILLLLVGSITVGSLAFGDIQSPPGGHWNWSRKLSRALANIAYGTTEVPATWKKVDRSDGTNAAFASAIAEGTTRSVVRLGYGLYELVTFPFPSYKGSYRPPYYKKDNMDGWHGYEEFPPQVGIISQTRYVNSNKN